MKKLSYFAFFLLNGILLTSCEPSTNYQKVVQNQSSKEIILITKDVVYYQPVLDSILIKAGESYALVNEEKMGYSEDRYINCTAGSGSLDLFYVHPIDSTEIEFSNSSEWIYEHIEKNNGRNHVVSCKFKISDALFN